MELPEKKLSDAELDVMLAVWQNRPPVLRSDLEEQLKSHNCAIADVFLMNAEPSGRLYLSIRGDAK